MWSKKVLGLYVVVSELFARSECLVYLLICLMTPGERRGQEEQLAIYFRSKHQNRVAQWLYSLLTDLRDQSLSLLHHRISKASKVGSKKYG